MRATTRSTSVSPGRRAPDLVEPDLPVSLIFQPGANHELVAGLLAASLSAVGAIAQTYPSRPITLIVHSPSAAPPTSCPARLARSSPAPGSAVIVDNRPVRAYERPAAGRAGGTRRLHHLPHNEQHSRDQHRALRKAGLRPGQGFHANHRDRRGVQSHDRTPEQSREDAQDVIAQAKAKRASSRFPPAATAPAPSSGILFASMAASTRFMSL